MKLDEYQEHAGKTDLNAVVPESSTTYYLLGLSDEVGEVMGKFKKLYRDKEGKITEEFKKEIAKELGDVLWYLAMLSNKIGYKLSEIAEKNVEKLASRKKRGKVKGEGDNR